MSSILLLAKIAPHLMIRLLIRLLLLSLVLSGVSSIAEQSTNDELIRNLAASRAVLEQLEDIVGSADVQLIEPLEQLAGVLIDLNLYVEADNLLDRAIQLTRINGGLYASEQLPLQVKKIDNLINQKNWLDVRDDLEHLEWLYISKSERIDTQLIFNLRHLSDLHTRGVAEDLISRQSYHFRKSVGLNRVALSMARAAWGEHDVRLSPIIYRLVKTYHIQAVALDLGGRTGYELRAIVPGSNWVRKRKVVKNEFYLVGMRLLNQLKDIHLNAEPVDLQGIAMVDLYIGDWQVLFAHATDARLSYSMGYTGLQAAGIEQELIDVFFESPVVLPEYDFFSEVGVALLARSEQQERAVAPNLVGEGEPDPLRFSEWSLSFPHTQSPISALYEGAGASDASQFALFSFSLSGVDQFSRWVGGTYRRSVGGAQEIQVLNQLSSSPVEESNLLRKVQALRFRPKLVDGVAQVTSSTLKYHLATE